MTGHSSLAAEVSEKEEQGYCVLVPQPADPDFPIAGVDFTGIGYIDGKLHIQYAVDNSSDNDNHGFFFLQNAAGEIVEETESVSFYEKIENNTGTGESRIDYRDAVFLIPEEELQDYRLYGDFVVSEGFHEGNWQVTFPIKNMEE